MGEASARRLRGGEMDDVIFAGSTARPSRNVAEVSLTIDNAARDAPFAFNDRDAIEIVGDFLELPLINASALRLAQSASLLSGGDEIACAATPIQVVQERNLETPKRRVQTIAEPTLPNLSFALRQRLAGPIDLSTGG